jgi:hypothetical protein
MVVTYKTTQRHNPENQDPNDAYVSHYFVIYTPQRKWLKQE